MTPGPLSIQVLGEDRTCGFAACALSFVFYCLGETDNAIDCCVLISYFGAGASSCLKCVTQTFWVCSDAVS
jgi:hypothetical protein